MSLRDALLAKGVVSKKDAERVNRELRDARKAAQGSKSGKRETEAQRAAEEAAARAAAKASKDEARRTAAEAREAHESVHRIRQVVMGNRLGGRGPIPFYYREGDGPVLRRLWLKEAVARDLRNGAAAICGFQHEDGTWEHHVVTRRAAEKLATFAPQCVAHFVPDGAHLRDPAESLMIRTWESGLGGRRVWPDASG